MSDPLKTVVIIAASTSRKESFAFETTLSGLAWLRHIRQWRKEYNKVDMLFQRLSFVVVFPLELKILNNDTSLSSICGSITTTQVVHRFC